MLKKRRGTFFNKKENGKRRRRRNRVYVVSVGSEGCARRREDKGSVDRTFFNEKPEDGVGGRRSWSEPTERDLAWSDGESKFKFV